MKESDKIDNTDNMGRDKFWEEPVNDGLALKIFSQECCENCSCKAKN
jgi:hypothetical protein